MSYRDAAAAYGELLFEHRTLSAHCGRFFLMRVNHRVMYFSPCPDG